jgi:hypothetical protein
MADDDTPPMEGDREWREEMRQTEDLARKLAPPHDDDAERGAPAPVDPSDDD